MTIEITKEAALKLIGNDEETWRDYKQDELAETSFYHGYGVNIQVIHNWVGGITQYYITDIMLSEKTLKEQNEYLRRAFIRMSKGRSMYEAERMRCETLSLQLKQRIKELS